ncbi:hypothetical protein ATO6_02025 [Oceanicola sp. 22II-s10i]|nr:hypothetical protein ATO6_02025 [Oceanicola sp. 22II-s10i]
MAEQGSFQAAANRLNLSPTAVGRRVRKLEDGLGTVLFLRTTRTVTLTAAGSRFLLRAQKLMSDLGDALSEIRDEERFGERAVAIGCLPTIAVHLLPDVLGAFAEQEACGVQVFDLSASAMQDLVRSGRIEFAVSFIGAQHDDLSMHPLYSEPIVALVSEHDPVAEQGEISWHDLQGRRLVSIGTASGTRSLIDTSLSSWDIDLHWHYEVQHLATAVPLAAAGLGIAIVPASVAQILPAQVRTVRLRAPTIERRIGTLRRRGIPLSSPASTLHRLIVNRLRG